MHILTFALTAAVAAAQDPPRPQLPSAPSATVVWGDHDGDGLQDALVVGVGGTLRLLENAGDGTFDDVTFAAGLGGVEGARLAVWEDYDGDGALDLFVGSATGASRLFRGTGDGVFEDATALAGIAHAGEDLAARWLDYDRDGRLDLFVRTRSANWLYHNSGEGIFESVELGAPPVIVAGPGAPPVHSDANEAAPPEPPESRSGASGRETVSDALRGPRRPNSASAVPGAATTATASSGPLDSAAPFCGPGIVDQATNGCLTASSLPTLGSLYPISEDLFVEIFTGNVGIGTTMPSHPLTVSGDLALEGVDADLRFLDDEGSIHFGDTTGTNSPMMYLFETAASGNTDRMVFAYRPAFPFWGLSYNHPDDTFVFQQDFSTPVFTVDLEDDRVGIGTTTPDFDLHIKRRGDAVLALEADTDNLGEDDQPGIFLFQDGGQVSSFIGYEQGDNHLYIKNQFNSNLRFVSTGEEFFGAFEYFHHGNRVALLTRSGNHYIDGAYNSGGADLAEYYPIREPLEPGDVVAFSGRGLELERARPGAPFARWAGIVSSKPGVVLGLSDTVESDPGIPFEGPGPEHVERRVDPRIQHEIDVNRRAPVALAGRVPVHVTDENGPIRVGDALTLSSTPGRAMRADDGDAMLGTALEAWTAGEGKILVFCRMDARAGTPDGGELRALRDEVEALREELALLRESSLAAARKGESR